MTIRAIAGLAGLNFVVLVIGSCVLSGIRGWRSWIDAVRLSGLAYLLGVASLFIVLTAELVVGIPLGPTSFAVTGACLALGGVLLGRRRRWRESTHDREGQNGLRLSIGAAVFIGLAVVYLTALFRAGRLSDLSWDVWASWLPKAKAIYYSGGIDADLFATLPGAAYPPGLPALHALAFHAMGSADATTLHLQYWFLAVGFVAAVFGLLSTRVRGPILFPLLLLLLLMPDVRNRATDLYGDIPLGYLVAASALLVLLWIQDSQTWRLVAATVLLGGAMLTKREGILFALCIVVAALVATYRQRRTAWPRLAAAGAASLALALPWRIWFSFEDLPSDGPESGYLGVLDHLDRAWPSHQLVVRTFFDYDLWLLVPTLGIAAAALAFLAGARREAVFTLVLVGTSLVGCAWTFWSNPSLGLGVEEGLVNRVVGTPTLMLASLVPLLLELAWRGRAVVSPRPVPDRSDKGIHIGVAVAIVAAALVVYPAVILADGGPRFPGTGDCVRAPVEGEKVRVVFGYRDTYPEAIVLRDRSLEVGFQGTEAAQDGCGRVRVSVDGIPSIAVGEAIVMEARTVGLVPTLELDPDA
ncbi:MAG: hypothetical protein HW413_1750 [Thermoleophilia bacterium]|nr:hypothetical protein [Thermoleophilia bacterium]